MGDSGCLSDEGTFTGGEGCCVLIGDFEDIHSMLAAVSV